MKKKIKNNDEIFARKLLEYRHLCKCGHSVILIDNPYIICSHCGNPIFRDKKAEFKYKVGGMKCFH
jgi:hypothetical protein